MKRTYFLFVAVLVILQAHAQINLDFRRGFMITNKNDTIEGYIDYRNLERCTFKESPEKTDRNTYSPEDIKGFGFVFNRWFTSKTIANNQKLFLECLVVGSASLYKYKSTFYLETTDTILPLEKWSKESYKALDYNSAVFRYRKYIGIINALFKACPPSSDELQHLKYSVKPLTRVVEHYNNCNSSDYFTYHSKLPWIRIGYGGSTGYVHSILKETPYCNANLDFVTNEPLQANTFTIGGTAYLSWPRILQSLKMIIGVQWMSSQYRIQHVLKENETHHFITGVYYVNGNLKTNEFLFPIGIRQTFGKGNFKPYFSTGIIVTKLINSSATGTIEVEYEGEVNTYNDVFCFKDNKLSYFFGLGIERAISGKTSGFAECRFEYTNGSNYGDTAYSKLNFYFLVGIKY